MDNRESGGKRFRLSMGVPQIPLNFVNSHVRNTYVRCPARSRALRIIIGRRMFLRLRIFMYTRATMNRGDLNGDLFRSWNEMIIIRLRILADFWRNLTRRKLYKMQYIRDKMCSFFAFLKSWMLVITFNKEQLLILFYFFFFFTLVPYFIFLLLF